MSNDSVVTHLAWSDWIELASSSVSTFGRISILAAALSDGSVHLSKILLETLAAGEIQPEATRELSPMKRLPVLKLAWARRNSDLVLAIARSGSLSLSVHTIQDADLLSSLILSCRHENFSAVVGKSTKQYN